MQTQESPAESELDDVMSALDVASKTFVEPSIIDTLSGRQKATALLVAMGQPVASRLIKYFSSDDLRLLSGQAQHLPDIDVNDFERLVGQFEDSFAQGVSVSRASERFASLVQENLPEDEAAAVLDPQLQLTVNIENIFETMAQMSPEMLAPLVAVEHPQVGAYIISRLPVNKAAHVLMLQSATMRADIIQRALHLRPVNSMAENLLSDALRPVLAIQITSGEESHYKQIAAILNQLDKTELDDMLVSLAGLEPQDLEHIKERMFVFEDLPRLSERARLLLFDIIDSQVIIRALRSADAGLVELILSSLSQRTRRMVETELKDEDMTLTPDMIMAARREIAQTALDLMEQGTIHLEAAAASTQDPHQEA